MAARWSLWFCWGCECHLIQKPRNVSVSLITFNKVPGVKMQCNPLASPQTIYCTWASLSCLARSSLVWFVLCSSMVRSSTVLSACLHCSWSLSLSWISSSSERSLSNSLPETYTHIQKTHRSWGCGYSKGFHSFSIRPLCLKVQLKLKRYNIPLPAVWSRGSAVSALPVPSPAGTPPARPTSSGHPHAAFAAGSSLR